jgi:hypothetical protein
MSLWCWCWCCWSHRVSRPMAQRFAVMLRMTYELVCWLWLFGSYRQCYQAARVEWPRSRRYLWLSSGTQPAADTQVCIACFRSDRAALVPMQSELYGSAPTQTNCVCRTVQCHRRDSQTVGMDSRLWAGTCTHIRCLLQRHRHQICLPLLRWR